MKRLMIIIVLILVLYLSGCASNPADTLTKTTAMEYDYPWWNDVTFYQVFVRSFNDSDGDGIGDINGLIEKLDYLNDGDPTTDSDLGVTGLWLWPIQPSSSETGFQVTNYTDINPDYGTLADFKRLIEECHKRGIYVVFDFEINHTSTQHPWFEASIDPASEYHDWYLWAEEDPGCVLDFCSWRQSQDSGEFYYAFIGEQEPELNYENPDVVREMYDAAAFWIKDMDVDGLQVDMVGRLIEEGDNLFNTDSSHDWIQEFSDAMHQTKPDTMLWSFVFFGTVPQISEYVQNSELDTVMYGNLSDKMLESVSNGYGLTAAKSIEADLRYFPNYQMFTSYLTDYFSMPRMMTNLGEDYNKAKSAATLQLTAPGIPSIYYGEEIGMTSDGTIGDPNRPNIRRPMQWDDTNEAGFTSGTAWQGPMDDYTAKNVMLQNEDEDSLLNHYRRLINLRNQYPALKIGSYERIAASSPMVYAVLRQTEEETILILANMGDEAVTDFTLNLKESTLEGSYTVFDLLNGDNMEAASLEGDENGGFADYAPFETLEPYSTYILWLEK